MFGQKGGGSGLAFLVAQLAHGIHPKVMGSERVQRVVFFYIRFDSRRGRRFLVSAGWLFKVDTLHALGAG